MLKRLSAATVLFLLCFVSCALCSKAVCKSAEEIRRPLVLCAEEMKNGKNEKATFLIKQSTDKFRKKQTLFDILLSHEMTSQLSNDIFSLEKLSSSSDDDTIEEKLSDCIARLERIEEEQKLRIGNIF